MTRPGSMIRRLRCYLRAIVDSLRPPLAFVEPHEWPWPPQWTMPRLRDGELVQYSVLDCEACGLYREGPGWRRWWGS